MKVDGYKKDSIDLYFHHKTCSFKSSYLLRTRFLRFIWLCCCCMEVCSRGVDPEVKYSVLSSPQGKGSRHQNIGFLVYPKVHMKSVLL